MQGTRQGGKTYSILEFGRAHYENMVYFNFETNPGLLAAKKDLAANDVLSMPHFASKPIRQSVTLPDTVGVMKLEEVLRLRR